ncbi:NAD(P)-binding Rossmann-fold containing protein [Coleophoma cylindrospora]|uniref:NAD(P)-binding Rossmann-fold containing protein n=1 Tax=Coleophoma cylindrospora TaxID=1849047 RepID=A0A3D8S939_9HELO|nr:NAD(P)-binding Rossmann-fold containing protein [Coleophoma cylindrospora]
MDELVVLITGASGGIGGATALRLAQHSPRYTVKAIALHYNSNCEPCEKVAANIHDINPKILVSVFQADMARHEDIERLYREVTRVFGPINVLFANAGTTMGASGPRGTLDKVSLETFEATWRINTLAPYQLIQLVVPSMIAHKFGRVIFNSSVAALTGGVVGPHYASSKSALHGMMHYLAMRHAKDGITFNAVAPALIEDTLMLPKDEGNDSMKSKIPVGRLGRPDEIAGVVQVMVETGYISNKVWAVDGGWHPM